ncbi:hypothetical protein GIB67_026431 [Kingdonia uniflora]|uniref:Uncharacterized protein n=1 Tax=Kingdonia uniflora TaxID=39325 RepID=A0A7J7MEJ2_9MAGN|nr:hypothetical protein GIB67_023057 [Kingdonia uniflora]KAF6174943.1 hypothetical protein GIB67_026431 [Kingdonia uniflora]
MSLKPPPFQEAERCDVCKCSFNAFRRRVSLSSIIGIEGFAFLTEERNYWVGLKKRTRSGGETEEIDMCGSKEFKVGDDIVIVL